MRKSNTLWVTIAMVMLSRVAVGQVLNQAEYFFNDDPGQGHGINLPITPAASIDVTFNIPTTSLSNGFHSLHIRMRDSNKKWSHFASRHFFIVPPASIPPVSTNIVAMEYFFNTDPGQGNATPIAVAAGADVTQNVVIPITSLQPGFHRIGIRAKDNQKRWAHFALRNFYIVPPPVVTTDATITRVEYFIDTEPGVGKGISLAIPASASQDNLFAIDVSNVQPGFHRLAVRYKSDKGRWSHFALRTFYIIPPGSIAPDRIVEVQYFVDVNPELQPSATPRKVIIAPTENLDSGFAFDIDGVTPGNHEIFVRVKNNNGMVSKVLQDEFTILDCTPPSAPTASPASSCTASSFTLTASGATGSQTYRWYDSENSTTVLHEGNSFTTPVLSSSRQYYVSLRDPSSTCESPRTSALVTILDNVPVLNVTGGMVICDGSNVLISAPDGYQSYRWSNGATTKQISVTAAGSYTVVVGNGSCESLPSLPAVVTVSQKPAKPVVSVTGSLLCVGEAITISGPAGAASYQWSNGQTTRDIDPTSAGVYTLMVGNIDGCNSQPSDPVVLNELPAVPPIFVVGNTTFCSGSAATLVGPSGYAYTWSNGKTSQAITETTTGGFTLRITDDRGCTSPVSTAVNLTAHPRPATPTIVVGGETSFCPGQSVGLSGPNGFSYIWSTGETTQTITASGTGSYSLLVRDANNCVSDVSPPVVTTLLPCTPVNARPPLVQDRIVTVPVEGHVTTDLTNSITDPDDDLNLLSLKLISHPASGAMARIDGPLLELDYTGIEFAGLETITIEVCDDLNNCTRKDLDIQVVGNVVVFNAISPNGDGLNESLFFEYISLLEESRDNRVRIFNRWGEVVYDAEGYNNTTIAFKGIGTNGDVLPPGTYFFRIDFTSGIPVKTGYFSLRR